MCFNGLMKYFFCISVFFIFPLLAYCQSPSRSSTNNFKEITIQVDTTLFSFSKNSVAIKGEKYLSFYYTKEETIAEIKFYPNQGDDIRKIDISFSTDFDVIDSVFKIKDYFKCKVRFKNLTKIQFLSLNLVLHQQNSIEISSEIKLLPLTKTTIKFYPKDDELYIGEEKEFELITINVDNIKANNVFTTGKEINYRTQIINDQLRLYLLPNKLGESEVLIELQTVNPFLDENENLKYSLPPVKQKFKVRGNRLAFLKTDVKDITLDDTTQKAGIEIQLDFSRLLQLQKTYRVDNKETAGGALVAEVFTKSYLSNGKILCILRPYTFHKLSDGYLYIKNGDEALSISNFTITPKTTINSVTVLHEGGKRDSNIFPGEIAELRIEGLSLNKASFKFEALNVFNSDSLLKTESVQTFKVQAPINIIEREIDIYNRNEKTGKFITLTEYQQPHQFNFININYGLGPIPISSLPQTILYAHTIKDIEITFAADKIDIGGKFFGKQFVDIEITVSNAKGDLIEIKKFDNVLICPGEASPRYAFYKDKTCNNTPLSLNSILGRKTYDLDGWSKIEIVFSHDKDKHNGEGFTKKTEIYLQRYYKFDTEVSFPGGLLIKRADQAKFSPFGGISLAIVQQMSFYHPEKINRYRPYKVGIGVLANNAFNFSSDSQDRDVGVVLLGSLLPTRRDVKLTFPLFVGGGYFLGSGTFFFLVGPGIYINL